jgi:hypothetical protein
MKSLQVGRLQIKSNLQFNLKPTHPVRRSPAVCSLTEKPVSNTQKMVSSSEQRWSWIPTMVEDIPTVGEGMLTIVTTNHAMAKSIDDGSFVFSIT